MLDATEKLKIETDSIESIIATLGQGAISFGMKLLAAIAILVVGMWLSNRLVRSLKRVMEKRKLEASLTSFLISFLNIFINNK